MTYKEKNFTGFSVGLKTGSKHKKRLSNHLRIEVDTTRTTISQKLTLREARALQKWLNDNLSDSGTSTSTSGSA